MAKYPLTRLRRTRQKEWSRNIIAENNLSANDLILPIFIQEGEGLVTSIPTMPGVDVLSVDKCIEKIKKAYDFGINAIMLFPRLEQKLKTELAEESFNPKNLICRAITQIKKSVPNIGIIADVALDPYTSHGHDGVLSAKGEVDNDKTVKILCKQALVLSDMGCDAVAPSDMMDGRILRIRENFEEQGLHDQIIISYSAKYCSGFYGPFRQAINSSSSLGTAGKNSYQMDPANFKEAVTESNLDVAEGADMLIIKPAMPYLDVIKGASCEAGVPIIAYQVSGEYAMMKFAALNGAMDYIRAQKESLLACKRAGACSVVSYAALEVAEVLK